MFNGRRSKYILSLLVALTLISLLFCFSVKEADKFYAIQYRFFELSLGGLVAIVFQRRKINAIFALLSAAIVLIILLFEFGIPADMKLVLIVIASVVLLVSGSNNHRVNIFLLENRLMVGIGKISFSLYMWHQIVLANARYFLYEKIDIAESAVLFG